MEQAAWAFQGLCLGCEEEREYDVARAAGQPDGKEQEHPCATERAQRRERHVCAEFLPDNVQSAIQNLQAKPMALAAAGSAGCMRGVVHRRASCSSRLPSCPFASDTGWHGSPILAASAAQMVPPASWHPELLTIQLTTTRGLQNRFHRTAQVRPDANPASFQRAMQDSRKRGTEQQIHAKFRHAVSQPLGRQ